MVVEVVVEATMVLEVVVVVEATMVVEEVEVVPILLNIVLVIVRFLVLVIVFVILNVLSLNVVLMRVIVVVKHLVTNVVLKCLETMCVTMHVIFQNVDLTGWTVVPHLPMGFVHQKCFTMTCVIVLVIPLNATMIMDGAILDMEEVVETTHTHSSILTVHLIVLLLG
jgi:hypothetical protein